MHTSTRSIAMVTRYSSHSSLRSRIHQRKIFRVITSEGQSVFIVIVLFVFIGHNYIDKCDDTQNDKANK